MSSERGNLFIVSAPSGSGKSTLVDLVLARLENTERCVTSTTRGPRGRERDGVDYYFLTEEDFERRIAAGDFLEHARVHGERLYGTSRAAVESGLARGVDLFLVIDVQGAASVRAAMPEAIGIFVMPPSFASLEARLRARSVAENHLDERDLAERLANARREVGRYTEFDYVIVNDDRDRAVKALASIVIAERCREWNQRSRLRDILRTFENGEESFHA
jgi:guanylate kinase